MEVGSIVHVLHAGFVSSGIGFPDSRLSKRELSRPHHMGRGDIFPRTFGLWLCRGVWVPMSPAYPPTAIRARFTALGGENMEQRAGEKKDEPPKKVLPGDEISPNPEELAKLGSSGMRLILTGVVTETCNERRDMSRTGD